jgi:regulator of protease activity HflC (stomatin/prohibitin superfamily)
MPVNVDAIIFWHVHDARKAALEITDYRQAIDRVAQTSLREMIGSSILAALLSDRKAADEHLRDEIGNKTAGWGVSVTSVEIRDVAIPVALHDAMSRQAEAEREKQARVILGSAEAEIAGKFVEAAQIYADHPAALQLRAMNIIRDDQGTRHHDPDPDVDGRQYESCLSSGARRPKDSRRGRPVAQERRLRIFSIADERSRPAQLRLVTGMHTQGEKRSSKDRGYP